MKVKYKNNHEETRLERHYSLPTLKNRPPKIFEMPMTFVFTHYLYNVDLVLIYILIFRAPKSRYNIVKRLILQIKSNEEEGENKTKKQNQNIAFSITRERLS